MSDQNKSVLYSGQQVCPSMAELKNDIIEKAELPTFAFCKQARLNVHNNQEDFSNYIQHNREKVSIIRDIFTLVH